MSFFCERLKKLLLTFVYQRQITMYFNIFFLNCCLPLYNQRHEFNLVVTATDRGFPRLSSRVGVKLSVVDRTYHEPIWDEPVYGPIRIPEDTSVGQTVYSVKARFVF